mgnify:CR=1 FL=1
MLMKVLNDNADEMRWFGVLLCVGFVVIAGRRAKLSANAYVASTPKERKDPPQFPQTIPIQFNTIGARDRAQILVSNMASNPIYAVLWLILLSFLAWPVAFFCAALWVACMVSWEQ